MISRMNDVVTFSSRCFVAFGLLVLVSVQTTFISSERLRTIISSFAFSMEESGVLVAQKSHVTTPYPPAEQRLFRQILHNLPPEKCPITNMTTRVIDIDQSHMFWNKGQRKLCRLLSGEDKNNRQHVLVNLTIDCAQLAQDRDLGTGNWLMGFYMARIAAGHFRSAFQFQCSDASPNYVTEVHPWLQGCYLPDEKRRWLKRSFICVQGASRAPLHVAFPDIERDMRRLLHVGTGYSSQPPLSQTFHSTVFRRDILLDQVAIHFRCGDALDLRIPRLGYGFTGFSEYVKRIPNRTETIGIVTQSFDSKRSRDRDRGHEAGCSKLVNLLVSHLEQHFPKAIVSIRSDDPIPLSFIRLMAANVTIIGLSTFSAFPIVAGHGVNYFERGRDSVNLWLDYKGFQNISHQFIVGPNFVSLAEMVKAQVNALEYLEEWLVTH